MSKNSFCKINFMLTFFLDYMATFWPAIGLTNLCDKILSIFTEIELPAERNCVYTNVLINQFFVLLPMYYFANFEEKPIIDPRNVYRIPWFFVLYELSSYYVHAFQHTFLPEKHRIHESRQPTGITSCYGHPIDIFFKNIPLFFSAIITNVSSPTFRVLNIIMTLYDILVLHGGYWFSFHRNHHATGRTLGMLPLIDMDDVHGS